MKRRHFIQKSAGVAAALSYAPHLSASGQVNELLNSSTVEIDLKASKVPYSLLPGEDTQMFCFDGQVTRGAANKLRQGPGFLGPIFDVRKGERIKVNFSNELPEPSIVHWHGLHLPENQDGHPSYVVNSGEKYFYDFEVENRAGLYWYHPHPHGRTGFQVYQGLAGLFIVRDAEEEALNLPQGDNEALLVFQDRHFDENNQLIYVQSGHDMMMGKMGDRLVVNGGFDFKKEVKAESYRLRLLNGSNARSYRLKWSDGRPLTIIGTDGGLLESPETMESLLFSPGERLDLIIDLEGKSIGDSVQLMSIPIVENPNAQAFALYEFNVTQTGKKKFTLPHTLSAYNKIQKEEAINQDNIKSFLLAPKSGMGWTIDGLPYEMNNVRPKERVKLGTTEIWEFDLTQAGMIHPMHIHGSQFQVLERINGPYSEGLVLDKGWKDTVSVLPGDKVRVIKRFEDYAGKFLYHCHILEHEDHSMMRDFVVEK